jgi:hypothetical protein
MLKSTLPSPLLILMLPLGKNPGSIGLPRASIAAWLPWTAVIESL